MLRQDLWVRAWSAAAWLVCLTPLCSAQGNGVFRSARNLTWLSSGANEFGCRVSPDGLELYFNSDRTGSSDLWMAARATLHEEFGEPRRIDEPLSSAAVESAPCLSADGRDLYFASTRPGVGGFDLYVTHRNEKGEPFGEPRPLALNTAADESSPTISSDGLLLYFLSNRGGSLGGYDIWLAWRSSDDEEFGAVEPLGQPISSPQDEWAPFLSLDGSTLFFGRGDPADLWMARRTSPDAPFSVPTLLGPAVSSVASEYAASVTSDWPSTGAKLYFISCRGASCDIWEATWTIVLDELSCTSAECDSVQLEWSNPEALDYTSLRVLRDGRSIATLDASARGFTDTDAATGEHIYTVAAGYQGQTATMRCAVGVECAATPFRRGDSNGDGVVDISDASFILGWLFLGTATPDCEATAEVNGSGGVDLSDTVYLLGYLFLGTPPPLSPFPECAVASGSGGLDCETYERCSP